MNDTLIYDVGLHRGEDTDFYLKKGFNVVAFEANPELILKCKARFKDAIANGRLRIIEGAIAPRSSGERVTFYKNAWSVWGTIESAWAERNVKFGTDSEKIEVPRVDIVEIYRSLGIPFYLKIDIEGVDRLALESLKEFEARPRYVSIESEKVDFNQLQADLALLRDLGYTKFKAVQQGDVPGSRIRTTTRAGDPIEHVFENHASGPFGPDLPAPWLNLADVSREYEAIFRRYRLFGDGTMFTKLPAPIQNVISKSYKLCTGYRGPLPGWHDIHASL